jgi:hypothetical protein
MQAPEGVIDGKGLYVEHIHCIAADPLVPGSVEHCGLVHYRAPAAISAAGPCIAVASSPLQ